MSKHYYIESDRIVSKIGGGFKNAPYDIFNHVYDSKIQSLSDYQNKSDSIFLSMMPQHFDSAYVYDDVVVDMICLKHINDFTRYDEPENHIFWYHKDHLGSSTQITDVNEKVIHHMEYMPSGEQFAEQRSTWGTSYKFNGKELDQETGLYYYGARYYNPNLSIWASVDPMSDKYPSMSPYMYCAGNPMMLVDPNGMEIFILFYTQGNKDGGDNAFKSSAETRKREIESRKGFNPEKDKVFIYSISDISDVKQYTETTVANSSEQYGKTAEVGIWSHSGMDGPRGSVPAGNSSLSEGSKQMSLKGWGDINFNWKSNGSNFSMYGCNSGNPIDKEGKWVGSFASKLSKQKNMNNVYVWGQSSSSFPSTNKFNRETTLSRSMGIFSGDTYMVGGNKGQGARSLWFSPQSSPSANPMNVYRNGYKIKSAYQNF